MPWQSRHSGATDAPYLNETSSQQSEPGQWHHDSVMRWDALALACLSDWDAMHAGSAFCDEMQSTSCPTTSGQSMHAWATGNQVAASTLDASSRFSMDWDYDFSTGPSSSVKISPSCFEESTSDQFSIAEETRGYFDCTTTPVAPECPGEDRLCQGWNMPPTSSSELPDNRPFAVGGTPPTGPWFTAPNSRCRIDLSSPAVSLENLAQPYFEPSPTEVPQDSQREEKFEASRQAAGVQSQCERYEARGYKRSAPYRAWPKRTFSSTCQRGDPPRRRRKGRPTAQEIMERNRLAANNSRLQQRVRRSPQLRPSWTPPSRT